MADNNTLEAIQTFMEKAKQLEVVEFPGNYWDPARALRRELVKEEYLEFRTADREGNQPELLDAIIDQIWVLWGTALKFWGPEKANAAAAEVARTNLAKVIGEGLPLFREDGKVIKPEGWQPPNIAAILEGDK